MNPNQIAQQLVARITSTITAIITRPVGTVLQWAVWRTGTVVILMTASVVLPPIAPTRIRPHGDITKLIYIAGILALMKHAGR